MKVTAFRDDMVELNQGITWVAAHVRDGIFGNWLANARDWNIGRNRFWGAPIPVWKSDDPTYPRIDVYGSLDEMERDFGVRPKDLHRPYVDELTRPNPDDPTGKSMMRRVEDVLDCWFESGSMPFAQVHYPFENKDWFDGHFPGDFIVEYVGQTRGWFYTLMVLSTALFDRGAVPNCHLPRRRARREQAEAIQAPEELSRPGRGLQQLRRRCAALVHGLLAAAVGRRSRHAEGRQRSARRCARCSCRSGTPIRSSRSTPTSTA